VLPVGAETFRPHGTKNGTKMKQKNIRRRLTMTREIGNRIVELGGKCEFQGNSLQDDLMSI